MPSPSARKPAIMIHGCSASSAASALIGALLVTVAGIGLVVAGLARNDCSTELAACKAKVDAGDLSWHHNVHDLASLVIFVALIAAQLVLARAFRQDARWQDLRTYSMVSGTLSLALLVLYGSEAIGDSNGLVQRVFTAVPFVWVAVLGLRLRRLAATDQRRGLTPERCP